MTGGVDVLSEVSSAQEPQVAYFATMKNENFIFHENHFTVLHLLESALALFNYFPLGLRSSTLFAGLSENEF